MEQDFWNHSVQYRNGSLLILVAGLLSLYLAKFCQAIKVCATDGEVEVYERLSTAKERNLQSTSDSRNKIVCRVYRWGEPLDGLGEKDEIRKYNTVVAADVTYNPDSIASLITTFVMLYDHQPALRVWVSAPIRNQQTYDTFVDSCIGKGLVCTVYPWDNVPLSQQNGFFHSTEIPVAIVLITRPDAGARTS